MNTYETRLASAVGFSVEPRDGKWIWRNEDATSDSSFDSVEAAWTDAATNAASNVMGPHDLSSEDWDAMTDGERLALAHETFGPSRVP